jgi:DNA (cytosine-5)-methyltransferase 1
VKFISLYSGIGGLDLGLERAGMECVAQVEKDNYCQKVLKKHWPDVPKFKDVHDVGKHNLPAADLICGGFPCQPHSLAGSRKGSADERDLWGETARIIGEIKPLWFLGENVPGILSSEAGRFFGRILAELAAGGYSVEWQSVPAAAFGAPHIRERVFIIAYRNDERTLEISDQQEREASEFIGLRDDVSDADGERLKMQRQPVPGTRVFTKFECGSGWEVEPNVGRVVDGFPGRVDRLKGLGNAVTPQQAEFVGRCIMEAEEARKALSDFW